MERRTYQPGEVIIQRGELNRDLFFLTEGAVEVSTKEEKGEVILNEMEPPQVFGDFAFYYGLPRTATVRAKTDVEVFILKYEKLKGPITELPELFKSIFTTFVGRIQERDKRIVDLTEEISALRGKSKGS